MIIKEKVAVYIIGPSGSGKSTLADLLKLDFQLKKISGGDMLRKLAKTPADPDALLARNIIERGGAADDDLVIRLYQENIRTSKNGVVFDGNPSGKNQAQRMLTLLDQSGFGKIIIIRLDCPDQVCIDRALSNPQRRDDKYQANIENRLRWYNQEVLEAFEILKTQAIQIIDLDATKTIAEVHGSARLALDKCLRN